MIPGSGNFYPKTFIYDSNDKFSENGLIRFVNSIVPNFVIVKPANLFSGQDIKIFHNSNDVLKYIRGIEQYSSKNKGMYIVQEYINNPLLYQGRKFDVRIFVLIDDDFNIYINQYGNIRTTSEKYNYKLSSDWEKDKFIHITNNSIQKFSKNYGKYEKDNLLDINSDIGGVNIREYFFPIWIQIINLVLLNIKNELISLPKELDEDIYNDLILYNRKKYFEFLGLDFIIDENLNTKLLEININPGTVWENKEALKMMEDLLKICIDPFFGINIGKYESSWIKI